MRLTTRIVVLTLLSVTAVGGGSAPVRARHGMVLSEDQIASQVGVDILRNGGTAIDAAIATAFVLAVTFPSAGNIGGGGFLVYRPASDASVAYDFREVAPPGSSAEMFLRDGHYDFDRHHNSYLSVGVPGTVRGLHLAWKEHGKLPWRQLVDPAVKLARDGFPVSSQLAQSLRSVLHDMQVYPVSVAQFSRNGTPYEPLEILKQPDLGRTLQRIAVQGPSGFYEGETAALIERDMKAHGGLVTGAALKAYEAKKRTPLRGGYRGYEITSMPPSSSGGTALIEMLNMLEGYDLTSSGYGSATAVHLTVEAMRRAFADRARYLGDPDFNSNMPIDRLISKPYGAQLRRTIATNRASISSPTTFSWPAESAETTQISVVDSQRNAVSLTYTLEYSYGSRSVVPGAGFLLNNEMGDFNAAPGLTTAESLIGSDPNLAAPRKRMLSSMTPTILTKNGKLFMVTGSPGGRTIINTVLLTILNVVDFGMNAQEAVDAGRFHHQWLPDRIQYERLSLSPDTQSLLRSKGHELRETASQGAAEVIVVPGDDVLEGGVDRRRTGGGAGVY
ncbi:MAG: gamma-glutamyltransferase [Vicinamibacterales bacterium]|nr:gamma-glutamyltransferase [Vicinamibacterales bacterium]